MSDLARYATERMVAVPAYTPGAPAPTPAGKLSSNESPFGPSPEARDAVVASIDSLGRYDGGEDVRASIAASTGVAPERLVLTNGSDELCYLIAQVFLARREAVVVLSDPTYAIDLTVSLLAGSEVRRVPLRDGGHDIPALAEASREAQLLWIPVPHNPTGRGIRPADFQELLDSVPESCLVVLDEAYRGFVDDEELIDSLALVDRHPNLLVQRTLSKDHGLAGLRVGYGFASEEIIAALHAARGPFTVNAAGLAAAAASLGSDRWRLMTVDLVRRERERLETLLDELGIDYLPSQANFVTVHVPWSAISPALEREQLRVRAGEDLGMPGWCRISMGLPAPMARMRKILRDYAEERNNHE